MCHRLADIHDVCFPFQCALFSTRETFCKTANAQNNTFPKQCIERMSKRNLSSIQNLPLGFLVSRRSHTMAQDQPSVVPQFDTPGRRSAPGKAHLLSTRRTTSSAPAWAGREHASVFCETRVPRCHSRDSSTQT